MFLYSQKGWTLCDHLLLPGHQATLTSDEFYTWAKKLMGNKSFDASQLFYLKGKPFQLWSTSVVIPSNLTNCAMKIFVYSHLLSNGCCGRWEGVKLRTVCFFRLVKVQPLWRPGKGPVPTAHTFLKCSKTSFSKE